MAYTPFTWANGASGGTPITAERLNAIEQGIAASSVTVDASVGTRVDAGGVTLYYHSGLREVSGELTNGWSAASVIIWRENSLVNMLLYGLDGSAATSDSFIGLPGGYGVANANLQARIRGEQVTVREWEADITMSASAPVVGDQYNGVLITWPAVTSYPDAAFGEAAT